MSEKKSSEKLSWWRTCTFRWEEIFHEDAS